MGVTCGLNIQLGWFLGNEAAVASVNEPHSAGTEAVTLVGKDRYQMMFTSMWQRFQQDRAG